MTGRTYLLGKDAVPVVVRARWLAAPEAFAMKRRNGGPFVRARGKGTPRNVLVELPGGSLVVRPFRGLRRPPIVAVHAPV